MCESSLPPDAELAVIFLADLERHRRVHGPKVLDVLAEKYPQAWADLMIATHGRPERVAQVRDTHV
jgi:hypothetical protein